MSTVRDEKGNVLNASAPQSGGRYKDTTLSEMDWFDTLPGKKFLAERRKEARVAGVESTTIDPEELARRQTAMTEIAAALHKEVIERGLEPQPPYEDEKGLEKAFVARGLIFNPETKLWDIPADETPRSSDDVPPVQLSSGQPVEGLAPEQTVPESTSTSDGTANDLSDTTASGS